MRLLLDQAHYVDDRMLDAGTEVGDGENAVHDWRYTAEIKSIGVKAGERRPPSRNMTPLDDEAKKFIRDYFNEDVPEKDPTKAIPLQGTGSQAKVPPLAPKATFTPTKAEPKKG